MKLFVKFIVLATLALIVQETLAGVDISEELEVCKEKLGVTSEEAEELHKGYENGSGIPENLKCLAYCVTQQFKILDSNNKFDVDKMHSLKSMEADEVEKVEACKAEHDTEEDKCEYVFKTMNCIMAN